MNELVKPTDETLNLLNEWLLGHGFIPTFNPSSDWASIALSVESVERLLDTEHHIFEHEDGTRLMRTSQCRSQCILINTLNLSS